MAARSTNTGKDAKATSKHGQFLMVNVTGKKCDLNNEGSNKNDRNWNKLCPSIL
jgi:hypothetical protein